MSIFDPLQKVSIIYLPMILPGKEHSVQIVKSRIFLPQRLQAKVLDAEHLIKTLTSH